MEHNASQDLEDPLLTLLELSEGHNEALKGILHLMRTFLQVLELCVGSLKQVLCLQDHALLLLGIQLPGVFAYALMEGLQSGDAQVTQGQQ